MTDDELLKANAHITDGEIWQDIHDTETEIKFRLKLNYDLSGVTERRIFITELQHLLILRREQQEEWTK